MGYYLSRQSNRRINLGGVNAFTIIYYDYIYMSFVVEIPTVFTKPTQIPARLGNTILTGNETIEGSLYVNGSLTLNNGSEGDSTNVVNYDSLDISNNLNVNGLTTLNEVNASSITTNNLVVNTFNIGSGNITSPKFRVVQPVKNLNNCFPDGSSATLTTIATNVVCYGGTLIFHVEVGGYSKGVSAAELEVRYTNDSGEVKARIECPFYFNQTTVHQAWSRTHVQTDVSASNMNLELWRNSTTLKSDTNDYINVTMYEMPY